MAERFYDPNKVAFEIRHGKDLDKVFRIYPNGRIEGFEDFDPCVVVNNIPELLLKAFDSRK